MEYSYVILCNGDFPRKKEVLQILIQADLLVCCDGAADELLKYREPDIVIGDIDSISERTQKILKGRIQKVTEQETNDLSKAFRYVCDKICHLRDESGYIKPDRISIRILGATGKREDHTLGNISHLADFCEVTDKMDENIALSMISDYGMFIPLTDDVSMDIPEGTNISLFSFDPALKITSEGLQYPVDNVVFDMWWKATLNCVGKSPISLRFNHKSKVLLYISF